MSLSRLVLAVVLALVLAEISIPVARAEALGERYRIHDRGQTHTFVIATDEVQEVGARHPEKIQPAVNGEAVRARAEELSLARGREVELVLYREGATRTEFTRRILTKTVLVQLEPGMNAQALSKTAGAAAIRPAEGLTDYFLLTARGAGGALKLADTLRNIPGVLMAAPQLARLAQQKARPNDPFFSQQWHLANTGQNGGKPGIDIGVTNIWNYFRGSNIYIGIVDNGLQYTHPDLAPNAVTTIDYDFNGHDGDPAPNTANDDYHGTAVAGLAAARGNNGLGVCGVAYEAKLVGLRLIALAETDADDAAAMNHSNAVIHIKNNSWGAPDEPFDGGVLEGAGPLMKAALAQGVANGRGGKGEIYVWAGGNGLGSEEDVNYDGYANLIQVIPVAALNDQGKQASYSEPGACLVVTAPSSDYPLQEITTTDLLGEAGVNYTGAYDELSDINYTKTFGGTSAATPIVSGVIALMLQANSNLGYRDVKEILLRSAIKVQPADSDWKTNSAGIAHNHKFGGGLINAQAAVSLATNWACLGPVTNISLLQSNLSISIPDNTPEGITRTFAITQANFRVEHLALTMSAPHPYWGDLAVTVTSPSGMQSRLAETHSSVDTTYAYDGWTFSSVRHWGEQAAGTWKVTIADGGPRDTGRLTSLELKLYGTMPQASLTLVKTSPTVQLQLQAAAPGSRYAVDAATDVATWTQVTILTIPATGKANFNDTNAVSQSCRFYRARLL